MATVSSVGLVTGVGGGATNVWATWDGCTSHGPVAPAYGPLATGCVCNSTASDSAYAAVTVTPSISSISPSRGLIGATTSVTISGKGFGTSPTVNAGSGITVTINGSPTNTQINSSFAVASSAPSGNHSVTVTAGGQTSGRVNFYVQVPSTFNALSVTSTNLGCATGTAGTGAQVQYQALDQASPGTAINVSGMTPQEHFTVNGTEAFAGFRAFATPPNTDGAGKFLDIPVGTCFGPPVPSFNACVDVIQTFNIVAGTATFPISTTTTRRDCVQGIRVQVSPGSTFTIGIVN